MEWVNLTTASAATRTVTTATLATIGDISTDVHMAIMSFYFYFLWPTLIGLGVVTNLMAIIVFVDMGLHDSVSISFLALSIADLLYLLLASVVAVTAAIGIQPWQSGLTIHVYFLGGYAAWYEGLFMETAMGIIAYISLARCCCVAIALKFKHTFTVRRTLVIIGAILCLAGVTRIPLLRTTGLYWYTNPANNVTRLLAYFNEDFNAKKEVHDIINRTIFPNVLLIIVFLCAIILTHTLIVAARTRREMTGKVTVASRNHKKEKVDLSLQTNQTGEKKAAEASRSQTLSGKEIQVVKQVTAVAGFLLLAVFVLSVNSIAQVIVPEFMSGRRYKRLYNVTVGFGSSCCHLNACVNLFIYLRFNRRFRQVFIRLFTCSGAKQT
ncbi:5-hydroxytryptamine receptor 2 [Biomphalaria pfeifferi]|uniref:5-hydroxytryptamine receptor 2 n=1 Tax=Biomphalaria pfeifferi TaxID=112525 RepID=A0AAD8F439_BIOPF|nr:5-hydroxytryptamine receptor 2 [Biomphalaria pfeifferi]